MMELDHFQALERILLPSQPAQAEPEPEAVAPEVAQEPPLPDFEAERGLDWIATARAALFTDSEGGEAE
jgi:hypothetical protein